jgi:DNA-binding NtrC family response regulator/tetratricopeptide (TPR) repeat protein
MNSSFETAERLFKVGEFVEILRSTDLSDVGAHRLTSAHQLLIAHALAITGDVQSAIRLLRFVDTSSCTPLLRSKYHMVVGLTHDRAGTTADALAHFQIALRFANASENKLQIAWARVHILRHMVDRGAVDVSTALLREARDAAIRAGDIHVTVFLHQSVSMLEGQLGRLDEAIRHCDIADSLLSSAPNTWLRGTNQVNRGCLAALSGRYEVATQHLLDARTDLTRCGVRSGGAENNLAHCYIVTGQFKKAGEIFEQIVRSNNTRRLALLGALEGLARLRLAEGDLDGCADALATFYTRAETNPELTNSYNTRWAAVTKGRLLLSEGKDSEALALVRTVEQQVEMTIADVPLKAAFHLIAAQAAAKCNDFPEAARRILEAHCRGVATLAELQAPYYFACSAVVRNASPRIAKQMRERAFALWKSQKVVASPLGIASAAVKNLAIPANVAPKSAGEAVDAVARAFELASAPTLLGVELLRVLEAVDCSEAVELVETSEAIGPGISLSKNRIEIPLSSKPAKRMVLRAGLPPEPEKAVLVASVARIAEAAVALQDAREEDRQRAALWPTYTPEMEAGALFLADEMQTLLATGRRVAPTNVPVLITGETGTGKEVLARAVHAYSNRVRAAFLPFNCTSTPRDMLDSQLFGHRRGSFTGAIENFQGIIRGAAGGTLFLDEIGDMALEVQPKLLRFLESGEVHPVGETQPVRADVRVIAATNANLDTLVTEGRFREDLFYRLNIVHLHIPPLRERRIEIPALAHHYLERYALEYAKGSLRLAEETMEYLVLYRWPGNVRQLANEMRRVAALCEPGAVVMPEHLSPAIAASRRTVPASERALDPVEVVVRLDQPMAAATEHLERAMLQHALKECGGRMEETAARLGLSRKGLYLKRQRLGIEPPTPSGVDGEPEEIDGEPEEVVT